MFGQAILQGASSEMTDVQAERPIQTRVVDGRVQLMAYETMIFGKAATVRFTYRLGQKTKPPAPNRAP